VNNGDMIRMQALTNEFTAKNPDVTVKWVTLEENVLRQRVTTDIATKGGQFDVLTIGTYEVPIWAKKNWLIPLDNLGTDYDARICFRGSAMPYRFGKLYAAPFYGESSMVMYRTDFSRRPIDDAGKADLGLRRGCSEEAHRQVRRRLRDLPEGQGRLGENMAY